MNEQPTLLDLFSGIGGFSLAFEAEGFRTIGFAEIDPYASAVLRKHWPDVSNYGDVRNITREAVMANSNRRLGEQSKIEIQARRDTAGFGRESGNTTSSVVDVIAGGFPCQPFSVAGKRGGAADDRHLWPAMLAVIERCRPAYVLGENVPGIIGMELDRVLSDLESLGYACWPVVVPACAVDARHRRDRVWIVAHCGRKSSGTRLCEVEAQQHRHIAGDRRCDVADAISERGCGGDSERQDAVDVDPCGEGERGGCFRWGIEPELGRVAHGIPNRSHRLRCLGNSIVPQVASVIAKAIYQQLRPNPVNNPPRK